MIDKTRPAPITFPSGVQKLSLYEVENAKNIMAQFNVPVGSTIKNPEQVAYASSMIRKITGKSFGLVHVGCSYKDISPTGYTAVNDCRRVAVLNLHIAQIMQRKGVLDKGDLEDLTKTDLAEIMATGYFRDNPSIDKKTIQAEADWLRTELNDPSKKLNDQDKLTLEGRLRACDFAVSTI